nr:chromosome segregation SMC family protein [Marinicella sp. W31]MDC2876095.1 chromosome segregation SMC family protein [Marinicella sp. W31]
MQLLFADASTGARSPSMVGQGRIGELIQAKPQARRQLLEEAAGISGLYSRRHEAELRLRGAETNLERLEDVTAQLSSQIESLKRQTRQATRFKSLSAGIRAHDAILLHLRWVEAKKVEAEATSALNQLTTAVAGRANEQMEAAKTQAVSGLKMPELRDEEVKAAALLQRLQIARRQLEDDAARMMRRRDELSRRLLQLAEDIRREEAMVADNSAILERLATEEAELSELLEFSGEEVAGARETMDEAAARLSESEATLTALTSERAEAAANRAQLERAITDLTDRRARLEKQIGEADSELNGISTRMAALPDPGEKREALDAAQNAEEEAYGAQESAEENLAEARRNEALTRQPVEAAKARLSEIETEARTIANMLSASAAAGDFTPLADLLSIEQGYETALGAVLGDDLEAPLQAEAQAHWHGNGDGADDPPLPAGCRPLSERVDAPPEVMRRLKQVGLVEDGEGQSLMRSLSPGQELVTKDGAVFRWDGYVKGADAPSAAALRLSQKNRLAALEGERREAEVTLEDVHQRQQQAGDEVRTVEGALSAAREAVRMAGRMVADARAALAEAERASGELVRRRDVVAETRSQLAGQLEDVAIRHEETEAQLAAAPDFSQLEQRLATQGAEVGRMRGELAEARARHDGLMRENDARKRRIVAIGQERASWENRAKGAEAQIATLRAREEEARDELEGLDEAPEELEDKRRQLTRELETAETARTAAADRLAEAEEAQREADRHAAKALADLAEAREKRGRAEERLVSARERREAAEARIGEVLEVAPMRPSA